MKKVLYHQEGRQAVELLIITDNPDGTADIGVVGADHKPIVKVHGCRITATPEFGAATVNTSERGEKINAARAKLAKLGKESAQATKAAALKPDDAALTKAADEASAALKAFTLELKELEASGE